VLRGFIPCFLFVFSWIGKCLSEFWYLLQIVAHRGPEQYTNVLYSWNYAIPSRIYAQIRCSLHNDNILWNTDFNSEFRRSALHLPLLTGFKVSPIIWFIHKYSIFRVKKISNLLVSKIYVICVTPILLSIPIRGYLSSKYSINLVGLTPSNMSFCSGREYISEYRFGDANNLVN
jgi:hypothetical protein